MIFGSYNVSFGLLIGKLKIIRPELFLFLRGWKFFLFVFLYLGTLQRQFAWSIWVYIKFYHPMTNCMRSFCQCSCLISIRIVSTYPNISNYRCFLVVDNIVLLKSKDVLTLRQNWFWDDRDTSVIAFIHTEEVTVTNAFSCKQQKRQPAVTSTKLGSVAQWHLGSHLCNSTGPLFNVK